ncbi:PD40 domain-containing protein [candidate division KSB1 bacterium]|nr:PD40 domain-containing protein [candidate division KSB1 bacterium]
MKLRLDFLSKNSAPNLEVFQLTTERDVPGSHIYMEAQIFTPDSRRFILHRSAHPHGSDPEDPKHQFLICDLENRGELIPITSETGATAPSVSTDGNILYYFVDETEVGGGRLSLKKVRLDGEERETLAVIDGEIDSTPWRPSNPYPLSTISSDGERLAISCFLGDGKTENAEWGLLVFNLLSGDYQLIIHGQSWCNLHPQYSRSLNPEERKDIMIQENHGNACDVNGQITNLVGGNGADIHLIRDDGSAFRNFPWGRDGNEYCQGHQCWLGRSRWAITSTDTKHPRSCRLIAGTAAAHIGHIGLQTASARRNDLTREIPNPDFYHFATDIAGRRLITDSGSFDDGGGIYLADLPEDENGTLKNFTFLINPGSSWKKNTHIHPFLSPDGKMGFFNSDESGILQAYMIRGWQE